MPNARYDYGLASSIEAEALGTPGQRRFRLVIESDEGNANLWLEKTQLMQLSLVIGQILTVPPSSARSDAQPGQHDPSLHQNRSPMDFDVGNISVGHDPENDLFLIEVDNRGDDQHMGPFLRFSTSRAQLAYLSDQAQAVCEAGRPICELCHAPMNPDGHICPKTNGHNLP